MFYGQPVTNIPWIWREVIPAKYRFALAFYAPDGIVRCGTNDFTVRCCLRHAYEQQIHSELLDPEWPSEYWDRVQESREGC